MQGAELDRRNVAAQVIAENAATIAIRKVLDRECLPSSSRGAEGYKLSIRNAEYMMSRGEDRDEYRVAAVAYEWATEEEKKNTVLAYCDTDVVVVDEVDTQLRHSRYVFVSLTMEGRDDADTYTRFKVKVPLADSYNNAEICESSTVSSLVHDSEISDELLTDFLSDEGLTTYSEREVDRVREMDGTKTSLE